MYLFLRKIIPVTLFGLLYFSIILLFVSNKTFYEIGRWHDVTSNRQILESCLLQICFLRQFLICQDFTRAFVCQQTSVCNDKNPVRILQPQMHVMCDHDDRNATDPVKLFQKLHNLCVVSVILARRWLIQDNDIRIHHQNGGDGNTFLLSVA